MTTPVPVKNVIYEGQALDIMKTWPDEFVDCVVTSPPYWKLRDYGVDGQLGLEKTPQEFIKNIVAHFEEVRRILKPKGTLWLNMGDSYIGSWGAQGHAEGGIVHKSTFMARQKAAGIRRKLTGSVPAGFKRKDLVGMPWRIALALQEAGWYLRADIIWNKGNAMPESCADRPSKCHEYMFLLAKSRKYYYNGDAIREDCSPNTHLRVSQDVANQIGSERAHGCGKKNGNMKAVVKKPAGWDTTTGDGAHGSIHKEGRAPGVNPKAMLDHVYTTGVGWNKGDPLKPKRAQTRTHSRSRQNESFSAATAGPVLTRNKRTVWDINTEAFKGRHFATFPRKLVEPCILAGCPPGGLVFDPFFGTGTTGVVAMLNGRNFIATELNPKYIRMAENRLGLLRHFEF